jgi:hypothetical protein
MLLRVVAKLKLSGFLLLLPGSSRITRGADAVGLLSNGRTNHYMKLKLTRLQMLQSDSLFLSTCILIVA